MRILLAEDERSLSRAIAAILRHAGYETEAVFDGEAALEALATGNYDAAILDIMMPQHDGLDVLRRLRERGDRTPVLLLTALSTVNDKVQGLDSGANDYLTKPFAARELLARVRAMTREQTDTPALTLGNVSLDRSTLSLSSPTGSFRLAKKEFQVLELLLCNAGHPIAAERLLERIWDSDADRDIVLVYISYLRSKLQALHASVHIRSTEENAYLLEAIP